MVKSSPKKPLLENITLSQWSVANMAILYKLLVEGKLQGAALLDYLSHTKKIYQFVQRYSLPSVLQYDRECRKLQAAMGFSWGTDVQHLYKLHLIPQDKVNTGAATGWKKQPITRKLKGEKREAGIFFVCVEVLRPSQPNGVMSSAVSLPNHTFTGQA